MATATKKKTKTDAGKPATQVAYLTKQVESLEKDLIRKDIKQLNTELTAKIDKVDTKVDKVDTKVDWLKWIVGGGLSALLVIMLYLHGDTKQDMKELKQDINKRFDKIERAIESINQKLK